MEMKKLNTKNIISNLLLGTGVLLILYGLFINSAILLIIGYLIWTVSLLTTR